MRSARLSWLYVVLLICLSFGLLPFLKPPIYQNQFLIVDKPDASSPRATLFNFMAFTSKSIEGYRQGASIEQALQSFKRAEVYLDTSEIASGSVQRIAADSGLLLYEILNRVGLPDIEEVPDADDVSTDKLEHWYVPGTAIKIHRVETGSRQGEFLFSPDTIDQSLQLYDAVKHQSHKTSYQPGNYQAYVVQPSLMTGFTRDIKTDLPAWLLVLVYQNPLWKWLACIALLGLMLAGMERLYHYRRFTRIELSTGYQSYLLLVITAFVLLYAVVGLIIHVIGLRFEAVTLLSKSLNIVAFMTGIFAVYSLIMLFAEWVIAYQHIVSVSLEASMIRTAGKVLAGLLALFTLIGSAEFIGFDLGPVLAGLGLGGLAVALAAKSTLENIIAGFTLFADRPVRIGDYCEFGDQQGTVVSIGLRSTRIRDLQDRVITIPNGDFCQMQIINYDEIRHRLLRHRLAIRYEAGDEQIRYLLVQLRELLLGHPKVLPDKLSVRVCSLAESAVELEIYALVNISDIHQFRAIQEDILLNVIRTVRESSCDFAFPSRSLYLQRDVQPDSELAEQETAHIAMWREQDTYPFPEFDDETRRRLRDKLDYPVKPVTKSPR